MNGCRSLYQCLQAVPLRRLYEETPAAGENVVRHGAEKMRKYAFVCLALCLMSSDGLSAGDVRIEINVGVARIEVRETTSSPPPEEPAGEEVFSEDTIEFKNGDRLTGNIESISDGSIVIDCQMIIGKSAVSLSDARKVFFTGKTGHTQTAYEDQVVFPNGDRLSLSVSKLDEKFLEGETLTGDPLKLDKSRIEGIIFNRAAVKVMDERFDDAESTRFQGTSGDWVVVNGKYVQRKIGRSARGGHKAYAPLTQRGRYIYKWTLDTSGESSYYNGFYFFANNERSTHGGTGYQVSFRGQSVILYKIEGDRTRQLSSCDIPSEENRLECELEFDSGKGLIVLKINGRQVFSRTDARPVKKGKYVMIFSTGDASFDDIVIIRLGDNSLPQASSDESDEDIVLYVNGETLSGSVVSVTEEYVIVENEYDPEGMAIPKRMISSMRFKGAADAVPDETGTLWKFIMWNDDIITGEILTLDKDFLRTRSIFAGDLTIPRELVKSIEEKIY